MCFVNFSWKKSIFWVNFVFININRVQLLYVETCFIMIIYTIYTWGSLMLITLFFITLLKSILYCALRYEHFFNSSFMVYLELFLSNYSKFVESKETSLSLYFYWKTFFHIVTVFLVELCKLFKRNVTSFIVWWSFYNTLVMCSGFKLLIFY